MLGYSLSVTRDTLLLFVHYNFSLVTLRSAVLLTGGKFAQKCPSQAVTAVPGRGERFLGPRCRCCVWLGGTV